MTEKNAVKSETVSPAREYFKKHRFSNRYDTTTGWSTEQLIEFAESYASQAIGAAAKEAAENVYVYVVGVMASSNTDAYCGIREQIAAIILRAIEKARTK